MISAWSGAEFTNTIEVARKSSEIGLCRFGDMEIKQLLVILSANCFGHWILHAVVTVEQRPRGIEGVGVFNPNGHFQDLALVSEPHALNHVQIFGMRCAEFVDEGLVVEA